MTNAERVWKLYSVAKEGQAPVIRSGYGMYGVYEYDPKKPFNYDRSESDTEHVFGTIVLLKLIMEFYPYLLPKTLYGNFVTCLLFHELGENKYGDIPDDGLRDEENQGEKELEYIKHYVQDWPHHERRETLEYFTEMQKKNSGVGRFLYFVDKTEAILQNLIYEKQGRAGDFSVKLKNSAKVSEYDKKNSKITESTKPADMWAFGFYEKWHKDKWFSIFFNIIRAAVIDVRGEDFKWLNNIT